MQKVIDSFSVAAKAWVSAAVVAVAPLVTDFVRDSGVEATEWAVRAVGIVVAWIATYAKPNKA